MLEAYCVFLHINSEFQHKIILNIRGEIHQVSVYQNLTMKTLLLESRASWISALYYFPFLYCDSFYYIIKFASQSHSILFLLMLICVFIWLWIIFKFSNCCVEKVMARPRNTKIFIKFFSKSKFSQFSLKKFILTKCQFIQQQINSVLRENKDLFHP